MNAKGNYSIFNDFPRMLLFPLIFYLVCFVILTFPLILKFSTHYFQDEGDGCQNLWNMWWVNKAVTELHQPVWYTNYLHYPHGSTLLGHTLNPFNGYIGILLQKFLTLGEAFNVMVIFSFVMGGWSAFYLAYIFSRSYWGSILAGYIFTFSSYHFGQAQGHMQLVSLEWLPLFIAVFYLLLEEPSTFRAIASAITLFLVILCDYYYAFYSVMTGGILLLHRGWRRKDFLFIFRRDYVWPIMLFLYLSLVTTGVLVGLFLFANARDPFSAGAADGGLDVMSLFVYGAHWRFGELTRFFWSRTPLATSETSVHLGFSVMFILVYAWVNRNRIDAKHIRLWYGIFIFFFLLALGSTLRIAGVVIPGIILPYGALTYLIPPLRVAGCTVRMAVMLFLSAGVIVSMACTRFFSEFLKSNVLRVLFVVLLVGEYLPAPMNATLLDPPPYVDVIKRLPPGAIVDTLNDKCKAHCLQTLYNRPRLVGYLSRYQESVERKYGEVDEVLLPDIPRNASTLYKKYKLRYILAPADYQPRPHLKLRYSDAECTIYELLP
ncbi:MAG: hypothetical protein NTZ78_12575 [Candidatus Aureabacteria bacterium]|nr:hypothetical protein [Candidatus Auribacterota bacterium]